MHFSKLVMHYFFQRKIIVNKVHFFGFRCHRHEIQRFISVRAVPHGRAFVYYRITAAA